MSSTSYDFSGRVAVITGGAGGIGLAIAERACRAGARVALWDRDAARAARMAAALGDDAMAVGVDVSDPGSVAEAAARTAERFGPADLLVNCAGIIGPNKPVTACSPAEWSRTIDINLNGTFLCCRELLPGMQTGGYGRVVNIASIAGKEGNALNAAYSASKAGVIALTKSLGKEFAQTGIRINCVTPATVETDMLDQITPEFKALVLSKIPLGRLGRPEEIASLVMWLLSEECSFSTGAAFDISGGRATY